MKIRSLSCLLFFALVLNIGAQEKLRGNKIVINEEREVANFSSVEINDNIDVILTNGNRQAVAVETDENLQDNIKTEVNNDVLVVRLNRKIIKKKALVVYITLDEEVVEITSKDRADIRSNSPLNFNTITLNALGDSKLQFEVKAVNFTLNNNESANVNLTVQAEDANINANKNGKAKINLTSGNLEILSQGNATTELFGTVNECIINAENKSNIKAENLECDDILVYASDMADLFVNAANTLSLSAINSAEIYIFNNPRITVEKFSDKAILRKK